MRTLSSSVFQVAGPAVNSDAGKKGNYVKKVVDVFLKSEMFVYFSDKNPDVSAVDSRYVYVFICVVAA